ncbi:hypothetical protein E2C01_030104 [Portunus trituberculatus]|uniref:Uncharacterized protein n=1 Tax=Portunus trituberculatus TaxID=210409 RepID=A0A5B7EUB4_PORTR|nr:hypothetical protein [Portunus trituberculatus]
MEVLSSPLYQSTRFTVPMREERWAELGLVGGGVMEQGILTSPPSTTSSCPALPPLLASVGKRTVEGETFKGASIKFSVLNQLRQFFLSPPPNC